MLENIIIKLRGDRIILTFILVALFTVFAGVFSFADTAYAQRISRVDVVGNQRIDADTIKSRSILNPGDDYSNIAADETVKAVFATGMFEDVKVRLSGSRVIIQVKESPLLYNVKFEGNDKFDDKTLNKVLTSQPNRALTRGGINADVERLREFYKAAGRYNVAIQARRIARPGNRVDVVYKINEGSKTGVKIIAFSGNKAFSDYRLRRVIDTRESGLFSWLSQSDIYSEEKLENDKEKLRQFYANNGYPEFQVVSANGRYDAKNKGFVVRFVVNEGGRYNFGNVNVVSSLPSANTKNLQSFIVTKKGGLYDESLVETTMQNIVVELSEKGYPFADIRPQGQVDAARGAINLTYLIDEGQKQYIERINISGNTRTRDYVIRREFELAEGDPYNQLQINRARQNLLNTGFFKDVAVDPQQGSADDKVILNVRVAEKATGQIGLQGSYSAEENLGVALVLEEKNLLGRGQHVSAKVSGSKSSRQANLSFVEPRLFGTRVAGSVSVYYSKLDRNRYRSYDSKTIGGGLGLTFPLNDNLAFGLNYNLYRQENNIPANDINVSQALRSAQGSNLVSSLGYEITYSNLDRFMLPTSGIYANFRQDFAGLGGDVKFVKSTAEARLYHEIIPNLGIVGMAKLQGGHMQGWGGEGVRIYDSFFKGYDLVRGISPAGLGPRDKNPNTDDALGGTIYYGATAELIFPIWGLPEELGLHGALFADAGTLYKPGKLIGLEKDQYYNDKALRASVGASLLWSSPLGPIRLDFGFPVKKQKYDKRQVFNLGFGLAF